MRRAATMLVWFVLGISTGTMLAVGAASLLGYQSFKVLSGSMEPAIQTGDLVIDEQISPPASRVGDVITFREPGSRRLITHRLVGMRIEHGWAQMRTRGDANNTPERWSIPADGQIGRVGYRIPKLGYLAARVDGRTMQLLLVVLPALLLGISELTRIWRPRSRPRHGHARPA
jgi:signal peptidase